MVVSPISGMRFGEWIVSSPNGSSRNKSSSKSSGKVVSFILLGNGNICVHVCVCVCVYLCFVCMYVTEREKEREREIN